MFILAYIFQNPILHKQCVDANLNIRSYMGADDDTDLIVVSSEENLLKLLTLIVIKIDPDIIGGWD